MKRFLATVAAAGLIAASPALAEHHGGGGGGGGQHVQRTTTVHQQSWNNGHGGNVTRTTRTTHVNVYRGGTMHGRTVTHVNTTRTFHGHSATVHVAHASYHSFRRNFTAPHRYHWGAYRRPGGWYAHRWVYGERVPHGWYGRDYWIGDYVSFGLIAPPDGYTWVRVGDDALLVDTDTGEVLQVEYGVFY